MTPLMKAIVLALSGHRFPLEHEKQTQNSIWHALNFARNNGKLAREISIQREVAISGGVIDFVVGDIGVEVKIKGQSAAILRQLRGYAKEPTLSGLLLVTSKPVSLEMVGGKPAAVLDMARAWL